VRFSAIIHAMTQAGRDSLSFPRALAALAACGFESVMLLSRPGGPVLGAGAVPEACLLDLARSDLSLVRAQADHAGVTIVGIYAAGVTATDPDRVGESIRALREVCQVARRLGCRHVAHPGGRAEAPAMQVADKRGQIQRLGRTVDVVARDHREMRFGVDVHYHGVIESLADCEYYLEQLASDNAGILLNTGHMTTCDQPGWELVVKHPERVPIIGWKDHLVGPDLEKSVVSVQLGTGATPLERYVQAVRAQSLERVHVINVEDAPPEDKQAALRASREYLERLWASA